MTPDAVSSDRAFAVRSAARDWKRSGLIDDARVAAVNAAWPDDRARLGPAFRALFFFFAFVAANSLLGLFTLFLAGASGSGWAKRFAFVSLVSGLFFAWVTEVQIVKFRRCQGGSEAATSLLAVGYLVTTLGLVLFDWIHLSDHDAVIPLLVGATALLAAAAFRWGFPLYAGFAAVSFFALLARLPGVGRLAWIIVGAALAPLLFRRSRSSGLPPTHRRSFAFALAVDLGAIYLASNVFGFDRGIIEWISEFRSDFAPSDGPVRWLSIVATAVVPLVFLSAGVKLRSRLLILAGALAAVLSLVTLRFYVHVAPLWAILLGSGAAAIIGAMTLRRWLDSGPDRERAGFTAEPLATPTSRSQLFETVAVLATMSPEARVIPAGEPKGGFEGGGGTSGGAGATGSF